MAVGLVDRQKLVNIADAVREKKGITGEITLDGIVSNIASIPTADNNAKYDFTGSGSNSSGNLVEYLTSIDLTGLDTSSYTSMESMFNGYKNLKSIDVSGLDTRNATNMSNTFTACSSLEYLDLRSWDTSKVESFWNMFLNCSSLKSIDVSSFNTSKVSNYFSFYTMFSGCSSLETIDLSNFDFSNSGSYSISGMFQNCRSLKSVKFPSDVHFNNNVTTKQVFSSCELLETLDLSSWNTTNVTSMDSMFNNCESLENLTLGENWASNSSITSFDLSYCPLTHNSEVDVLNKLATRDNSPVIKFSSKVGLYQSEIDIATNKGWSVSGCTVVVDAETATVGQYALIDGEVVQCVYVADEAQDWGQRIFFYKSSINNIGRQWGYPNGVYGASTGITDTAIGTGLSNTNALITMNLQSTVGSPTIWDAVTEFRSTHSDRWFVPSKEELGKIINSYSYSYMWSSTEFNANYAYCSSPNYNPNTTTDSKSTTKSIYVCTYV